jgi:hypothetical protein
MEKNNEIFEIPMFLNSCFVGNLENIDNQKIKEVQ